jgi:hypothetical protein
MLICFGCHSRNGGNLERNLREVRFALRFDYKARAISRPLGAADSQRKRGMPELPIT